MMPPPPRPFLALCAALALLVAGSPAAAAAEPLRIATDGVAGIYHALGSALCRLLEPDLRARLDRCHVLSTEGSLDNLRLVRSGGAEVGIAQAALVEQAVAGAGAFAGDRPNPGLRVLFAPLEESLAVLVRPEDDVHRLEDLSGRPMEVGPPGARTRATVAQLVAAAGVEPDAFLARASPMSPFPADSLCGGDTDAIAFVAAHPHAIVQEAMAGCEAELVPLDGRALDRVLATGAGYRRDKIGPRHYLQLDAPLATIGSRAFAVADARLPDEVAYRLTATVFAQLDDLRRLHLSFAGLDRGALVGDCAPAPYHPGALAYLAEAGITLPDCP